MPPVPKTETERLFQLLQDQTHTFQTELRAFRWELRVIVIIVLILGAARDGVLAKLGMAGFTLETSSVSSPIGAAKASEPIDVPSRARRAEVPETPPESLYYPGPLDAVAQ
jgi:hypothetical protein